MIWKYQRCWLLLFSLVVLSNCTHIPTKRSKNFFHKKNDTSLYDAELRARVVLDAGHGGHDSGAVGHRGLLEKDVTLDIAKRLQRLIHIYLPNVDVVMTRDSDRYVGLEDRITIADKKPGDVFLSLHINSSEEKSARGFEIFSLDIAKSRHAERLALRENKSSGKNSSGVKFILADLRAFSHRQDSDRLARGIAQGLNARLKKLSLTSINDRGYNQAIFHVLFVKMPSALAELGFISNPQEEQLLSMSTTRDLIAQGLFLGVKNYLTHTKKRVHHEKT